MRLPPLDSPKWNSTLRAFAWGMSATSATILSLVLFVTYIGIGALSHDTRFSLGWAILATALVWAGPAQIILITTLASSVGIVQAAIAGDDQCYQAVTDGGRGAALDEDAADEEASSDPGRAFHSGYALGGVLSLPAACAA